MDDFIVIVIFLGVFIGIPYIVDKVDSYKKNLKKKELEMKKEFEKREKEIQNQIQKNLQIENDIKKIKDNTQNCPWLADRISDYYEMLDTTVEKYLRTKKNPAVKASQIVAEIKKEKKELIKENKKLEYQLTFLKNNFPMLEDAMQLNSDELTEALNTIYNLDEKKDEYEIIKEYISPEEYEKLSTSEKYQLALDRYQNKKKKSLWQIGISYERYIGYIYENMNYDVIYNGALEKKGDFGRDIIAENNDEILIIQCKYWKKESVIRENAIFQLYGTMILKQLETTKKVKGILVTTTSVSSEAKQVAKYLNIQIRENEIFDKTYPCIKCNVNKTTGEKIYHLPFDQQYDRIKIDITKGEKYVSTIKEAENYGFRRAKKHIYSE